MKTVSGIKVLTAEDDTLLRKSIVNYLEGQGYIVLEAANGMEALILFRQEQPDLVITDLCMPTMDGLDLLAMVVKESPDTPVLVLSGMGTMHDVIEVLRIGAWDYLTKPLLNLSLLLHAVEKALERAILVRATREYPKLLEKKLALAKGQWERTVDAISDLIFLVDKEHRFLWVNKAMAEATGVAPADAIGTKCYFCVHDNRCIPGSCPQDKMMIDGQARTVKIYEKGLGGDCELKVLPYYDLNDKTLAGSVHILHRLSTPQSP